MAVEQMNISLSTQMARFVRSRVKSGDYTNISEVVRDAIRRMQQVEAFRNRALLRELESRLTSAERRDIGRRIQQGIRDVEEGRFEDYDADRLMRLPKELVAASLKKHGARAKRR